MSMGSDGSLQFLDTLDAESLAQDSEALKNVLVELFALTSGPCSDRAIRRQYLTAGKKLLNLHPTLTVATIIGEIEQYHDASDRATSASSALLCLNWVNLCLECVTEPRSCRETLISYQALLLDVCCGEQAKTGIRRSALHQVKVNLIRGLTLRSADLFEEYISVLTEIRPSARNAILIGNLISLLDSCPARPDIQSIRLQILDFYKQFFLLRKKPVNSTTAQGLNPFFALIVTKEDVVEKLLPAMWKALLRAPEIVAEPILTAFISSVALENSDASLILVEGLSRPLISMLKSSSISTRQSGSRAVVALERRAGGSIRALIQELVKSFSSDRPSVEQRVAIADCLQQVPMSLESAEITLDLVLPLLLKEPNEAALLHLISAVWRAAGELAIAGSAAAQSFVAALCKGVTDKKASIRNHWICSLASIIRDETRSDSAMYLVDSLQDILISTWQADCKTPLQSLQNGMLSGTYGLTTILLLASSRSTSLETQLQNIGFRAQMYSAESPNVMFSEKICSRITQEQEQQWLSYALECLASEAGAEWRQISGWWAAALLRMPLELSRTRPLACIKSESDQQILAISLIEQTAIKIWITSPDISNGSDSQWTAAFLEAGLRAAAQVIQTSQDGSFKDRVLTEMLILAHHPCLEGRPLWIELCQIVLRDPAEVVQENADNMLTRLVESIRFVRNELPSLSTRAALAAMSTIAFISPEAVVPGVMAQIIGDLSFDQLKDVSAESLGIWLTPEGQTFVDVLGGLPEIKATNLRGTRDWETDQWEASVRAQIAEKKALPKRLSKEEQVRLHAQTEKEKTIRDALSRDVVQIRRGLGLVRSLNHPWIQAEIWFVPVINQLLSDLLASSRPFIGTDMMDVYLECSSWAKNLGSDSRLLGLAILTTLSDQNRDETRDLINRVLYKLRFASEQETFNFFSLSYALPLIKAVLGSTAPQSLGCTGCKTDDQIEEQTFLALEFLDRNIGIFSDPRIDRLGTIDALINVVHRRPSQASDARSILHSLFNAMADNATLSELKHICDIFCHADTNVRNAALSGAGPLDLTELEFSIQLWLALHDDSPQNAELAKRLFEENAMVLDARTRQHTMQYLSSTSKFRQVCASRALAHTFALFPDGMQETLEHIMQLYVDAAAEAPPVYDRFGQIVIKPGEPDKNAQTRQTIALALIELCPLSAFEKSHVAELSHFLLRPTSTGRCPLADRSFDVRAVMLQAGSCIVRRHGHDVVEMLLPVLEHGLARQGNSQEDDWTREAAVVLYGAAASYLKHGDARVPRVIEQLLATLQTPSESVQLAIAQCLPRLVANDSAHQPDYLHQMLTQLSDGKSFAERRGAAFGLAGVVKGCGVSSLQELQVMEALEAAATNRSQVKARQGALFAYECFAQLLGTLWEPYIHGIIPLLLLTFADNDADVRNATQDTARAIMSQISGYGVQLILPSLLSGLNDHQWRSKKGSVELIGAMAYCAPRQLSASLPTIIPRLNEVLTDSHAQVRAAGNASLTRFGQVISNPEIQELIPVLMRALSDPNKYTESALNGLLKTSFLHYIDSPSLSILIPILQRGMQERSATTKKKSSKIFGLLASLTSPNDLVPHLASLVPCLRLVLVDTVPDVRATAAKALGSLVEKLGERNFPDLVTSFLDILNSEVASTDRQGAAQGLSEVLAGLGIDRLDDTLPRILKDSRSRYAYVREGFISLLIYLPATFGTRFAPYLAKSIGPILAGLADESEFVRDASLRAGKIMIANYATKSVDLMLPELEQGMFNDSWRIRVSSLQLIGDLLFKVSGIATKSKADDEDEDDAVATEAQRNALLESLGQNRRDRIFSSLYVARFDSFAMVRSSAINVWKTLVANTPKTLRDILPALIDTIISSLAIENAERRAIFVETLGDLMRKMGRDLLNQLLPAFEEGLQSSDADRIGVCVAITEVITSSSSEQIEELEDRFVSAIKIVLIDQNPAVRAAANDTFDSLQTHFGPKVIDKVLPGLLALLQSEDKADEALEALKGLMQVRSHVILPILLPGLLTRPMTRFNLQAIGSLVRVAGQALTRRLPVLLTTILDAEIKGECPQAAAEAFETILVSTSDGADSVATVMNIMLDLVKHEDHRKRAKACKHLAVIFSQSRLDYSRYVSDWIRVLLALFADPSEEVVQMSWFAQDALTKSLRKEELAQLVSTLRRSVQSACVSGCDLPGFSMPKGLSAILPILLQGLLYGSPEQKEEAALGLSDVVRRTHSDSLKVFVTQITGPLIRIIGERSGPEVKSAILSTLQLLLQKIPAALKPFLPQLQRSFTKSLAERNEEVRLGAASALGSLISLQTARIDPLITELVLGSQSLEASTSSSMLSALFEVVGSAGVTMGPGSKTSIIALIKTMSASEDASLSSKAADLLGVLFRTLGDETQAKHLLDDIVFVSPATLFSVSSLNGLLLNSSAKIEELHLGNDLATFLADSVLSTQSAIAERSITAVGKFLLEPKLNTQLSANQVLITSLAKCIRTVPSNSSDTQRLSLIVLLAVARRTDLITPHIDEIGMVVFSCVRSPILPVKLAAESAFVGIFKMSEIKDELLQPFLQKQDPVKARSVREYAQRVASKVANAENERTAAGIVARDDDLDEIIGRDGEAAGSFV